MTLIICTSTVLRTCKIQKFSKKMVTARRPLLYGVGSTCLYLVEGSCRYLNIGTYREPHAAYLNYKQINLKRKI